MQDRSAFRSNDVVAREANVSVAKLTEWRERALAGAAPALRERERDDREDEIARLKSKVGEITVDNELLSAKIAAMEAQGDCISKQGQEPGEVGFVPTGSLELARLNLPRSEPFSPSFCMTLMAMWRRRRDCGDRFPDGLRS
jgi:hypothetical protein